MFVDETFAVWQNMSVLMKVKSILRSVGERVERGRSHMLRSDMMLMLVDQVRRRQVAERLWVRLVDHVHPSLVVGLGRNPTSRN